MKKQIFEIISNIKKVLLNDFFINTLLQNRSLFNQLYASLDLIEDTELAINFYKQSDFKKKTLGEKYILIYGLFEAFYIQYDAVKKIIKVINDTQLINETTFDNEFEDLNKIKEYRNDIAGHPAYRDKQGYSVYLSQHTLSKEKIEYLKSHTQEIKKIDIIQGIDMQENSILNILKKIFEKLKIKEEEHYNKYKDEKLYAIFNKNYMYTKEIIFKPEMFNESNEWLKKLSKDIKEKLNERYVEYKELDFSYLIYDIDCIIDFLENKLEEFDIDSKYKNFIKNNMVENLTNKFDNLMDIFREIDKKYEDYFNPQEEKETVIPTITIIDDTPEKKEVVNVE